MSKPRQPIAQIGAVTLWKLACAASEDVDSGDDNDPYVKEIRDLSERAQRIACRRLSAKGLDTNGNPKNGGDE